MFLKKLVAFTMAEILIVLAIIGIVAALSLPVLNTDAEDNKAVAQLRKMYTELESIYQSIVVTYGKPSEWDAYRNSGTSTTLTTTMGGYIAEFAGVKKNCGFTAGCFPTATNSNTNFNFLMKDASSLGVVIYAKSSTATNSACKGKLLGVFTVDISGLKGDNQMGYDTFKFPICEKNGVALDGDNPPTPDENEATAWVVKAGNRDYLKCALSWNSKRSCK